MQCGYRRRKVPGVRPAGVRGCPGDGVDGHNRTDADDTALWARRWLGRSEMKMREGLECTRERGVAGRDEAGLVCYMMYDSIMCAVKACLLHHGMGFQFTRDGRALHEMLPPGGRMSPDFGALADWGAYFHRRVEGTLKKDAQPHDHTANDVGAATAAAKETYGFVSGLIDSAAPRQS